MREALPAWTASAASSTRTNMLADPARTGWRDSQRLPEEGRWLFEARRVRRLVERYPVGVQRGRSAVRNGAGCDSAVGDRAVRNRAVRDGAVRDRAVRDGAIRDG